MSIFKRAISVTLTLAVFALCPFLEAATQRMVLQPLPEGGPSARYRHTAVHDTDQSKIVFFGGLGYTGCLNDVWSLDLNNLSWTQISATGDVPQARRSHAAIYDPQGKRMIVFGGTNPGQMFNDVYSLDLSTYSWSALSTTGPQPSPRWDHTAIYNSADSSMVIFGGRNSNSWFNEMWKLNLNTLTWSQVTPLGQLPPARGSHTATYIAIGNFILVFAGYSSGACMGDLWRFDFSSNSWSQILTSGDAPLPRSSQSALYDGLKNRLVVFGGIDEAWLTFDDVWEFDLSSYAWKKLFPLMGRAAQMGIYDPQRQGMILFGGVTYPSEHMFSDGYVIKTDQGLAFSYGDANCDGDINVTDAVYLINYLFRGGPAPCSPSQE